MLDSSLIQDFPERLLLTYKQPEEAPTVPENEEPPVEDLKPEPAAPVQLEVSSSPLQEDDNGDLLGLDEFNPAASEIEESNALALAILPSVAATTNSDAENSWDPSGWELALVNAAHSSAVKSQLGGGFDKLTLDSLYDEAAYRQQQQQQYHDVAAPNPFMAADPFTASNEIAAPPSVQMAAMAQQQSLMIQSNPFMQPPISSQQQQQHPPIFAGAEANPFTDTTGLGTFPVNNDYHKSSPFGSSQLL
ncbi:putative clathrin assembly protein At2g01600 [Phalaenopsis equestris]|uniref:putative clathrin assembly protein At2g01600 n=1 Tax=Phalaenopsis equestris TaxID=78828 RepID=UPI0009E44249|nr:putative clathrin assembly protein At2g01600 [Phalaenopsis equestris]